MARFRCFWFVCALVLAVVSCVPIDSFGRGHPITKASPTPVQAQQVVTLTASVTVGGSDVATPVPTRSTPLSPAKAEVTRTPPALVEKERDDARAVVEAFCRAVSKGDVEAAMSYWHLGAPDQPAGYADEMRRLVAGWATGQHWFIVGEAKYGGLVGPHNYQQLVASDPRAQKAVVTVMVDGREGAFHLDKIDTAWLISGYVPPGTPLAPVGDRVPAPKPVYMKGRDVFRVGVSGEEQIGTFPEDASHLEWGRLGLAYVSDHQIQVLHPYEGTTHVWFSFPERAGQDFDLRWSDDGLALAYSVAWDEPDGSRHVELGVLSGAQQQTIIDTRVARAAGPTPTPPPMPPASPMSGFAILHIVGFDRADGRVAVTPLGGQDRYSAVWFYGATTAQFAGETLVNVEIYEMALAPDQTLLAVSRPGRVEVWPLGTDAPPMVVELPENTHAAGLCWSTDGQRLAYLVNEGPASGLDAGLTQGLWVWQEGHARQLQTVNQQAMLHGWVPGTDEVVLEVLDPVAAQMSLMLVDMETGVNRPAGVPEMARLVGWSADY